MVRHASSKQANATQIIPSFTRERERETDHKQPANANQIVYIENTLQRKDPRIPLQEEAIYVGLVK